MRLNTKSHLWAYCLTAWRVAFASHLFDKHFNNSNYNDNELKIELKNNQILNNAKKGLQVFNKLRFQYLIICVKNKCQNKLEFNKKIAKLILCASAQKYAIKKV